MKARHNILIAALAGSIFVTVGCSKDELGESIFDTNEYALDKNTYSFPLDTFVKVNFLEPYNMRFIYRMEYIGSDKDKNLTPASYENSSKLAVLTKYLWYDTYKEADKGGEQFLKQYSPRIIHVIGSKNLNTSSGTETLGVTEGGTKVTLYRVNLLDPDDIDNMNEYFFETMHHEFGHILDNAHLHPFTFNMLSSGRYNAAGWSDTPDSVAASQGFISPYASMSYTEDWVETLARYITRDSLEMERCLGAAQYEWEIVDLPDADGNGDLERADYNKLISGKFDIDTIGYFKEDKSSKNEHKLFRRVCERDNNDYVVPGEDGKPQWKANISGAAQIIQNKIQFVREYMMDTYHMDIDKLRQIVQDKQFLRGADGKFTEETYFSGITYRWEKKLANAITHVNTTTGKSKLDELMEELEKYKTNK